MNLEYIVAHVTVLNKKGKDVALSMLKRIAAEIQPILSKRKWKVGILSEFFNPSLLGMNVGCGHEIHIRLREISDENLFLPYDDLIGTMLHELCHIKHGPHDHIFNNLLDELNEEYNLAMSGMSLVPFEGKSMRLGDICVSGGFDSRVQIVELTRRALAKRHFGSCSINDNGTIVGSALLFGKSQRCGTTNPTLSPGEAASLAAKIRNGTNQ